MKKIFIFFGLTFLLLLSAFYPISALSSAKPNYHLVSISFANKEEVREAGLTGVPECFYLDLAKKTAQPIWEIKPIFRSHGFSIRQIRKMTYPRFLRTYPNYLLQMENPILFKDGDLIKIIPGINIYVVEGRILRLIPGPSTFISLGYNWSKVIEVSGKSELLKFYRIGEPMGPVGDYIYRSNRYGFEIKLKKTFWKGYRVQVSEMGTQFRTASFSFEMPTRSPIWPPGGWASMFILSVATRPQWQAAVDNCLNEGRPADCNGEFLKESQWYVYYYSRGHDCPEDLLPTCDQGVRNALSTLKVFQPQQ